MATLSDLLHAELAPADARSTGKVQIDGDTGARDAFVRLFARARE